MIKIYVHLVFNLNVLFGSFTVFKFRASGSHILRGYLFTVSYITAVQNTQPYKRRLYLRSNKSIAILRLIRLQGPSEIYDFYRSQIFLRVATELHNEPHKSNIHPNLLLEDPFNIISHIHIDFSKPFITFRIF